MTARRRTPHYCCALAIVTIAALGGGLSASAGEDAAAGVSNTATPIKHVVVVIGENRSFDTFMAPMSRRAARPC